MAKFKQSVFVSYAWGGISEETVNQIDKTLQARGIKIIRDKRDLGYKGSIKEFMELIGQGNCVIVVISDKYLRSPNCMFELVEIADNKQLHDRIFPIVMEDANIYDPVKRIEYVKHWETKRAELAEAMRTVDPANLQGIRDDMDQYARIRDKVSGITSILKDMNTLTPDMHKDSNFKDLYDALVKRLKEPLNTIPVQVAKYGQVVQAGRPKSSGMGTGILVVTLIGIAALVFYFFSNGMLGGAKEPTQAPTSKSEVLPASTAPATETVAPTATITAPTETVSPTNSVAPTETVAVVPTEAGPPQYFALEFKADTDLKDWASYVTCGGSESDVKTSQTDAGMVFNVKNKPLCIYYYYKPVTYKDVATKLVIQNFGVNSYEVGLFCRKSPTEQYSGYEYSIIGGGLWGYFPGNPFAEGLGHNWWPRYGTQTVKSGQVVNEMVMTCIGDEISLHVNGQKVNSDKNSNFLEGTVGFSIKAYDLSFIDVKVLEFEVSEP